MPSSVMLSTRSRCSSAFPVRGIRPLFLPRRTGILVLLHFCSSRSSLVRTTKPLVNATVAVAFDKTLKCDQLEHVWGRLLANIHCAKTCASTHGPSRQSLALSPQTTGFHRQPRFEHRCRRGGGTTMPRPPVGLPSLLSSTKCLSQQKENNLQKTLKS